MAVATQGRMMTDQPTRPPRYTGFPRLVRRRRRPRIVLLLEHEPPARDPRLCKQANALVADGCEVTVICRSDSRNEACVPGAQVLGYPAPREGSTLLAFAWEYSYSLIMAAALTIWVLLRYGFDVMQTASMPDVYFVLTAPCRWLGRPVVFDFRDPSPETYAARYGRTDGAVYQALLSLERYSMRCADRVLVVNQALRCIARQRGGVDDARIVQVGNGPPAARAVRHPPRPGLRQGRRHLCCWVGLIGPQDRLDLALRVIAHLVHERHRADCSFVFIGAGEGLPAAQALAAGLGVADWVSFPGWVEQDRVFDWLCTADIGLESGTEDFVSPVKVMEYMAAGLPVVAFSTDETVRLAADAALYAPKGDVAAMARLIDELLGDPGQREHMGRIGQGRVRESIAWEHQAQRYLAAIHQLIRYRRGRRRRSRAAPRSAPAGMPRRGAPPRENHEAVAGNLKIEGHATALRRTSVVHGTYSSHRCAAG